MRDNSDTSWERLARSDPYFAVLTGEEYHRENLTADMKARFFASGEKQVEFLERCVARYFGGWSERRSALDFGCGVGRVAIPLAKRFGRVVGIDVAPSMIEEARRNAGAEQVENVEFQISADFRAQSARFDLVHSVIVLQHIPAARGEGIIRELARSLAPAGILAIQFYFRRNASWLRRWVGALRRNFAPANMIVNILQGRRWNEPLMQMNVYDLGRVVGILAEERVDEVFLQVDGAGSTFLFARRPAGAPI